MTEWKEPDITINGTRITNAMAMTIRVALGNFQMSLDVDGLGDDDTGKGITEGYLARIAEIYTLMKTPAEQEVSDE